MSTRARTFEVEVGAREELAEHLVRLELGGGGLDDFASTGVPDEWLGLVVPGQFQSRYYTVRSFDGSRLVLDVVRHEVGLVTEWVGTDCVGQCCTISEPRGAFELPADCDWVMLVGDLTALPAMARVVEQLAGSGPPVRVWAEVPDDPGALEGYLPAGTDVTWLRSPAGGGSRLAETTADLDWPDGEGYFWMGGESAQMRAIRKHLMRERGLPSDRYHVMGYWRGGAARQPREVDPGPIWRAGKAAGKSDEQIWADYDDARAAVEGKA